MEQAAWAISPNTVPSHAAELRLRRGASDWGAWAFDDTDQGAVISVGLDPRCHWTIRAAGVAPLELFVLFAPNGLFAKRAERGGQGRVDGRPLSRDWERLHDGSRIDFGVACLEVSVGEEQTHVLAHKRTAPVLEVLPDDDEVEPEPPAFEPINVWEMHDDSSPAAQRARTKGSRSHATEDLSDYESSLQPRGSLWRATAVALLSLSALTGFMLWLEGL